MLSIREIQEKTVGYFSGKGVPNPKLDADLLIAHVLGLKRLELYLDIDRPLTEEQLDQLRPLVKRRAEREPLQYILGTTEFFGMQLKVDPRALIPRPETEELVEHIRDRVAETPKRILDLGTGSGAIAIALASMYPEAEVWATDQSEAALELAKENAAAYVSDNRIHFQKGSWWEAVPEALEFDLVVSNPPYLTQAEMKTAEPEVVKNEPESALVSGPDGLEALRQIMTGAKRHLAPGGMMALETGIAQHRELATLCAAAGLKGKGVADMSGRPRFYFVEAALAHAPTADLEKAQPNQTPDLKPNAAGQLRKGHTSKPDARYFITCCTQDRTRGLETEACASAILSALNDLHLEASIDLLSATVMPDHIHILLRLGRRLELSQAVGKLKAITRDALHENGLVWQENDYDHRLRTDDAAEKFAKYIFLNPYRSELIRVDEIWPWWVLTENYQPEFMQRLEDPPLPPKEWLGDTPTIKEIIREDQSSPHS